MAVEFTSKLYESLLQFQFLLIKILLFLELYTMSCEVAHSSHMFIKLRRPYAEGLMSIRSSAYIRLLIIILPDMHPIFCRLSITLKSLMHTLQRYEDMIPPCRSPFVVPKPFEMSSPHRNKLFGSCTNNSKFG